MVKFFIIIGLLLFLGSGCTDQVEERFNNTATTIYFNLSGARQIVLFILSLRSWKILM